MKTSISTIVENLITLQQAYAHTPRAMVTEERYSGLINSKLHDNIPYSSLLIREPLIEHVGHLPIIAAYLHPLIQHTKEVDLGRSLIMLSIHDIGETKVGDMLTFAKNDSHAQNEYDCAKELLPKELLQYLDEMEERKTFDAKFAKAVDSMSPLLHEMVLPKVTADRMKLYDYDTDKIYQKKYAHFEWDDVLKQMFLYFIEKYREIEKEH